LDHFQDAPHASTCPRCPQPKEQVAIVQVVPVSLQNFSAALGAKRVDKRLQDVKSHWQWIIDTSEFEDVADEDETVPWNLEIQAKAVEVERRSLSLMKGGAQRALAFERLQLHQDQLWERCEKLEPGEWKGEAYGRLKIAVLQGEIDSLGKNISQTQDDALRAQLEGQIEEEQAELATVQAGIVEKELEMKKQRQHGAALDKKRAAIDKREAAQAKLDGATTGSEKKEALRELREAQKGAEAATKAEKQIQWQIEGNTEAEVERGRLQEESSAVEAMEEGDEKESLKREIEMKQVAGKAYQLEMQANETLDEARIDHEAALERAEEEETELDRLAEELQREADGSKRERLQQVYERKKEQVEEAKSQSEELGHLRQEREYHTEAFTKHQAKIGKMPEGPAKVEAMKRLLDCRSQEASGPVAKSRQTLKQERAESMARMHQASRSLNGIVDAGNKYTCVGVLAEEAPEAESRRDRDDRLQAETKRESRAKRNKAREDRRKDAEFQGHQRAEAAARKPVEKEPHGAIQLASLKEYIAHAVGTQEHGGSKPNDDANGPLTQKQVREAKATFKLLAKSLQRDDGVVTKDELIMAMQGDAKKFALIDSDHDGRVTSQNFTEYLKQQHVQKETMAPGHGARWVDDFLHSLQAFSTLPREKAEKNPRAPKKTFPKEQALVQVQASQADATAVDTASPKKPSPKKPSETQASVERKKAAPPSESPVEAAAALPTAPRQEDATTPAAKAELADKYLQRRQKKAAKREASDWVDPSDHHFCEQGFCLACTTECTKEAQCECCKVTEAAQ